MTDKTIVSKYKIAAETIEPIKYAGRVEKVSGLSIESVGPKASVGELCTILKGDGAKIEAEVIGLSGKTASLMTFGDTQGIEVGCRVIASGRSLSVPVSERLLGRVVDALGRPLDGKGAIRAEAYYPVLAPPPPALSREPIRERIVTGVRAIDGLLAIGKGQRVGIFAGSGVGKSTLQGMIARNTNAQVNVAALIGERGRELREFIENDLGEAGMKRTCVVVSTGDENPLARLRAAYTAHAVAEYFRDQGNDVMLLLDSITRFARAMREVGRAVGESPVHRGYPPSVFDSMQKLLERPGMSKKGSITAFYTVLVDADDMDDPIADTVRGILDGHIVLSRRLAERRHFPSIDVSASISRCAGAVQDIVTRKAASAVLRYINSYNEIEDMLNLGAYKLGSNPSIDEAIAKHEGVESFLTQDVNEPSSLPATLEKMASLADMEIPDPLGGFAHLQ